MNLTRNHVIYYKGQIAEYCEKFNLDLPDVWYQPTPPVVPENYMARTVLEAEDEHQRARVKRLWEFGEHLTSRPNEYRDEQRVLW